MIAGLNRGSDALAQQHRAHRQATGERLGQRQQIGFHVERLIGEQLTRATQAALHLVEDQQHVLRVRELTQRAQIRRIQRAYTALTLHRLHDDCRGAFARDRLRRARQIARLDETYARHQWLERLLQRAPVRRRQRAEQPAMKRAAQRDDLVFRRAPFRTRPAPRELERAFVRFRAGVAEEDAIREGTRDELLRELGRWRGAEQVRRVDHAGRYRASQRLRDAGIAVPEGVHANAAREVEVALAGLVDQPAAVCTDQQRFGGAVYAEQRGRRRRRHFVQQSRHHATPSGAGRSIVPAAASYRTRASPMRTFGTPQSSAFTPALNFTLIPPCATPDCTSAAASSASSCGRTTPPSRTPGTSVRNTSSLAARAAATAAAASSAFTFNAAPSSPSEIGDNTTV